MREEDIHVGDLVRIRQWDDMFEEYGGSIDGDICVGPNGCWFVSNMAKYCGKVVRVKRMYPLQERMQYEFEDELGDWSYTCNMLEPLAEAPEITGEFDLTDLYGGSI